MTKGEIFRVYGQSTEPQRRSFAVWLANTAVIATVFALGLAAIAWVGFKSGPRTVPAQQPPRSTELSAVGAVQPAKIASPYDLTLQLKPSALPVERVDEPY